MKPDMGFRTVTTVGNLFDIIFLQFVGHHLVGMGFDFIMIMPLPSHCSFLFVFGHGLSLFGGFQHLLVDGFSTASCNFGVLIGGDECTSFYSTILNWKQKTARS